jgi:hypothetical protein
MFKFTKTALVAMTLALGISGAAQAGGYHTPSYKTLTVYVAKQVPYTVSVKKIDAYGGVHWLNVTRYKTIQVPVTKYVRVSGGYARGY